MKTRTITLHKSEIFFDIDAVTHIFSRASEGNGLQRADALEADTLDPTNKAMVTRFADRHVAELKEKLSRFLTTETKTATAPVITTATSYAFSLYVEDAFQDEALDPLGFAMEQYIAEGCIADWYRAAGDPQAASYQQYQGVSLQTALGYLVKRKFPSRT